MGWSKSVKRKCEESLRSLKLHSLKGALAIFLCVAMTLVMAGCGAQGDTSGSDGDSTGTAVTNLPQIDMSKWQYNSGDDVYYQTGISYCETPADETYETLAVFVPGDYMKGEDNGDGTFTCELDEEAEVGGYTAASAPIVIPINTPGYSAQAALTDYTDVSEYTDAGLVYVHAGCRGRDAGAPAGVTDLKAAIRYIRYCDDILAGDTGKIFTFGMSGGGAQSAVVGSSGDSSLYDSYLKAIGAVQGVSDAVEGSMCWCPITNLDTADEAYEWMMGSTRSGLTDDEQQISDGLAAAFASYINEAGITDEDGNVLTLAESAEGIWQAGSYYTYMKSLIEKSLENFLEDTEFPYDASASTGKGGFGGAQGFGQGGPGGFGARGGADGDAPDFSDDGAPNFGNGEKPDFADGEAPDFSDGASIEDFDNITRTQASSGLSLTGTYETAQDYIDALNENTEWVTYDAETGKVTITSIADFVSAFKTASKGIGAFDQLDGGQGENELFGYGDGSGAHFDGYLADILNDMSSSYAGSYATDLSKTDSAGNIVDTRVDMYTPLYYLLSSQEGYKTSTPAKYWRIRTGINQSDCALSTEMDLALALESYEGVESVDFETVWGQAHTEAERTGSSTDNFIAWVNECAGN